MHMINAQTLSLAEVVERAEIIGLSDKQLSSFADMAPSTLSRWHQGKANPTMRSSRRISRALIDRERQLLDYLARLHPDRLAELAVIAAATNTGDQVAA